MSNSLIKGHLGVEICHYGDITKREIGRSLVNVISVSFDKALRNIKFNYLIVTSS